MRKWSVRAGVLLLLVAAFVVLRHTVLAPEQVAVRVHEVQRGQVESTVANSKAGTVEARRRAKLSPGTSGVVVELFARRGDRVSAGALLLRLENSLQAAQLELVERELDVTTAQQQRSCIAAERALRELERNRELASQKIVSVDVLDALENTHRLAEADCAVAAAEVERARAAVEVARAEFQKTELRAPFDARVAEVAVELGEWVTPSVPLLAAPDVIDAIDLASLYVSAPMDEVDSALLSEGQPVRVTLDPFPDRSFPGRVARIAPYVLDVEQQNRTLEIEVELDDADLASRLLPGTSADVEVILDVRADVLRVPSYALLQGGTVLVLEGDALVERAIELGMRNWEWAEVTGGLEAGERVALSLDRPGVEAGARVTVEPEPGAQGAARDAR
jgi:HlyD family secretion protein